MKIAVYTIALNERHFLQRWADSAKDADYLLIADTGSTDGSCSANVLGPSYDRPYHCRQIVVSPWRFDDARNASLALLPADIDIAICLDMDEILVEGWRAKVEAAFTLHPDTDRLRYNYVWSWNKDGTPGVTYHADKIHKRHGFRWVNPVHEVLKKDLRLGAEKQTFINDTLIEHYPDLQKSRSQYLPLLELAVKENPHDDRAVHYLARDLMAAGRYGEARDWFAHHVTMPEATWDAEISASWRYQGDCNFALGNYAAASHCFVMARKVCPHVREPYISLAQLARFEKRWLDVKVYCECALAITERPNTYINSAIAWSDWPNQMLEEAINHLNGVTNK